MERPCASNFNPDHVTPAERNVGVVDHRNSDLGNAFGGNAMAVGTLGALLLLLLLVVLTLVLDDDVKDEEDAYTALESSIDDIGDTPGYK